MSLDRNYEMSDQQAVTADAQSTDTVDIGAAAPNQGHGGTRVRVEVSATYTAGAGSLVAALQDSSDNSVWRTLIRGHNIPRASLTKKAHLLDVGLPAQHRRYLRIDYDATATITGGTVNAYLYTQK